MNEASVKPKKKIKLQDISYYFFIILFIILMLNTISARSEAVYKFVGFRTYTVLSGSMEPEFYPGDLVLTLHKNKANLKQGDIITFTDNGEVVTHRIIKETKEGYVTKGDNNNVADAFVVTNNDIIGKVLFHIPKAGYVIQFLAKPMVVAAEMILLAIFIFLYGKDS